VPLGVLTATKPVVAPPGTVAVRYVSDLTLKVAGVPLKETPVVPLNPWPRISTVAPTLPELRTKATNGPRFEDRLETVPQPPSPVSQKSSPPPA
jgi:hypothetical protein